MIFDIFLGFIALATLAYAVYLIVGKFPHLANINITTVPEAQQSRIRYQILEDKLKRDLQKRWGLVKALVLGERKKKITSFLGNIYRKLKELEQEYRLASTQDLSTRLSTSHSIEQTLAEARKAFSGGQLARAEQLLIDALKLDEHSVKVYALLADVYKAKGEFDHARETLEFLLTLTHNEDASVYQRLATIAFERGDLQRAHDEYSKSISLDPNNYHYYLKLAEVYHALGQHDKARDAGQKSLVLAPQNPKILDFLVENSILLQDAKRATEYVERLRLANPNNGKLKSFGERIAQMGGAKS